MLLVLHTHSFVPDLLVDSKLGVGHCHSPQLDAQCLRLLHNVLGIVLLEGLKIVGVGLALRQEEFALELLLYLLILLKDYNYFLQDFLGVREFLPLQQLLRFEKLGRAGG